MKFPKIDLKDSERLWLSEVYRCFQNDETINSRVLKAKLYNKLSPDFSPDKIDRRLLRDQTEITLLGILHIEPKTDFTQKCEDFINEVKATLLDAPDIDGLHADQLSSATDLSISDIRKILNKISDLGHFWSSLSEDQGGNVTFGLDTEVVFDEYMKFQNVTDLLKRFFRNHAPHEEKYTIERTQKFDSRLVQAEPGVMYYPIFHSRIDRVDKKLAFVLMPFAEKWSSRVYDELIRAPLEKLGLQCLRADNLTGQIIIEDIWTKINQCALIIADVTGRNANVMYELGIVHTIGKPAILLIQDMSDIPFDFAHLRHYEYEDNTEGFRRLQKRLPEIIREIYLEKYDLNLDLLTRSSDT